MGDFRKWRVLLIAFIAGLIATGCMSVADQRTAREKERYAAYSALPPEMRSAVDQGLIRAGMNMDAVYIAWGKADQVVHNGTPDGETVTWNYFSNYMQVTHYWGYYGGSRYAYTPMVYLRARVIFKNGVVKEWQTYGDK